MSTQQDIYAAGSENRPPMLNKENYVPWSSRLLRYAKSRPNGNLICNSIMNGPYVRRMIPEPGDANGEVPVPETFHEQSDDKLTKVEIKQMEADDQAIQTILLGLPEDIYAVVDSCETAQEIWLRVQQMMKGSDIGIQEKKAKLFNEWEMFTSTDGESIESYDHHFSKLMNDFKRNKHFPEKIASNLKFLNNLQPEWSRHVTIVHQTKDLHTADYTQLYDFLKYNQKENVGNHNGLIVVSGTANQNGNGNVVATRAEGSAIGNNAAAADLDEIEEVNANCILMANLHVEQGGGTVEQHSVTIEETRAYQESLFHNLAAEVEKVNTVNRKMKETNAELTTELATYKNQEKCFEISQEKYDKLESSCKQITALNEEISNLNKQLSKEKSTVSSLQEEKKRLKSDFKIREDELLDKQIQLESKIKELDNILVKTDTSNLQTELERTKERFENCIIKKENEYAKLWNDWYKKCEECKYYKISYDKAYNDMQQKIERLQAQLRDQKGKSKDTPCVSDTLDPLSQKLENENVELEFQVLNYAKENAHLKTTYKNLFDSIKVTRAQTKAIIDSLQDKLHDTMYENAKLRAQLFDKVFEQKDTISEQKDTTKGTSTDTKFANQSTERKPFLQSLRNTFVVRQPNAFQSERLNFSKTQVPQKVDKMDDLSNPDTSNSVPTTEESKVVENDKVIAPGMFRINPFKNSKKVKYVPNKPIKASVRTNPITVPQPHVITKKVINSDSNGFSSTGVDITTKTRRPQPRSNTKNDRVLSTSKSSRIKNKEVEVEEHPMNLLLSKNKKYMSSECNNIKLAIWNDKSEIICAMCKQCLITVNHDVCVLNYLNGMNSYGKKQMANVSNIANQMKHLPQVKKPKKVGFSERLA
ncbi:hypothetical protein Tco_0730111 [Tanacetum coccineum]|uniref:Gag-Pol polyprotein n=1 Tax=Tanacetum coccineum TaxID=301880 RepID=A0ABQ4YTB7_9ASTR